MKKFLAWMSVLALLAFAGLQILKYYNSLPIPSVKV